MQTPFIVGFIGSIILVLGAAWPVALSGHPAHSRKNQLFFLGNVFMSAYAIMNYFEGGSFFFILLQCLIAISTILMMLNTDDRIDTPIIVAAGVALVVYALYLSHGVETLIFVVGLCLLGLGFSMNMGTVKQQIALAAGSVLIALFSFIASDPIFLWLNIFFALFSGYHAWKIKTAQKG